MALIEVRGLRENVQAAVVAVDHVEVGNPPKDGMWVKMSWVPSVYLLTLRNGKIWRQTDYFGPPFDAPA
jgi:hypothetical protein